MAKTILQVLFVIGNTTVIYLFLLRMLSLMGHRATSELVISEIVVIMMLGSAVETPLIAGDKSLLARITSATLKSTGISRSSHRRKEEVDPCAPATIPLPLVRMIILLIYARIILLWIRWSSQALPVTASGLSARRKVPPSPSPTDPMLIWNYYLPELSIKDALKGQYFNGYYRYTRVDLVEIRPVAFQHCTFRIGVLKGS